jgi:purine-nucleoside phosphorylase
VTLPVRAAILAGARTVVLTNAAGGIAEGLAPGNLAVISDHLDMTGRNPLIGPNDDRLGPRFPDMSDVYTPALRRLAREVAEEGGETVREVVYAWWLGPSFETPAEIRMLHALGADVVGMSTVPEAIAARHMGAAILGISLITNRAAGLSDSPLSSDEVIEIAHRVRPRLEAFLDRLLARPQLVDLES